MLYPLLYPFFAKEYQGIPKTKIKNVDLTTFYQGMQKNAKELWSRWESNPRPNTCQHICLQP